MAIRDLFARAWSNRNSDVPTPPDKQHAGLGGCSSLDEGPAPMVMPGNDGPPTNPKPRPPPRLEEMTDERKRNAFAHHQQQAINDIGVGTWGDIVEHFPDIAHEVWLDSQIGISTEPAFEDPDETVEQAHARYQAEQNEKKARKLKARAIWLAAKEKLRQQ